MAALLLTILPKNPGRRNPVFVPTRGGGTVFSRPVCLWTGCSVRLLTGCSVRLLTGCTVRLLTGCTVRLLTGCTVRFLTGCLHVGCLLPVD